MSGLCKALQRKGHLVEIVVPKYDCMNCELITDLKVCNSEIAHAIQWLPENFLRYMDFENDKCRCLQVLDVVVQSYFDGQQFNNKIWVGTVEGSKCSFKLFTTR